MVLVNTDYISGQQLQTLTLVRGSVVMTKHIGSDIGASFQTIVGGEVRGYLYFQIVAHPTYASD